MAQADELSVLSSNLCEKMKACALEEMQSEGMDVSMRAMIQPMLDNMCVSMAQYTAAVAQHSDLRGPATACLKSLQGFTCADFKRGQQGSTPECREFEEKANAARKQQ
ncbi:MAG: hypothetical protein CSA53_01060 [Gammaproteobacteria bacterium]|nr:MAG: hypothetical protein CSA53_01060 [Gammaproteobacteria bacterium]